MESGAVIESRERESRRESNRHNTRGVADSFITTFSIFSFNSLGILFDFCKLVTSLLSDCSQMLNLRNRKFRPTEGGLTGGVHTLQDTFYMHCSFFWLQKDICGSLKNQSKLSSDYEIRHSQR